MSEGGFVIPLWWCERTVWYEGTRDLPSNLVIMTEPTSTVALNARA